MDEEQGFPEWTELGQQGGLDPLGMQRPIEAIYQDLVPGISTITLRIRYYSFFCWMLETYAQNTHDTSEAKFRSFQRRCELLFALVSARGDREVGVAGIDWARDHVAIAELKGDPEAIIEFGPAADPKAAVKMYLENQAGAFGAIYVTQMHDMGLVEFSSDHSIPVCSDRGLGLAVSFAEVLGPLAETFLQAVVSGEVSLATLDTLRRIKPSKVDTSTAEYLQLVEVLLGKAQNATPADLRRRETMAMLLVLTGEKGQKPHMDDAKWQWLNAALDENSISEAQGLWAIYQLSDLLRQAYEYILDAGLWLIEQEATHHLSLSSVVARLVDMAELPTDQTWGDFSFSSFDPDERIRVLLDATATARAEGEHLKMVSGAFRLVMAILVRTSLLQAYLEFAPKVASHFQSLSSEGAFFTANRTCLAGEVAQLFVRERVIKRHLWVASRKFRNQRAYTYLMEPADGALRYRKRFEPVASSPRLEQALNFLEDVKLIDRSGLTALGVKALAAR